MPDLWTIIAATRPAAAAVVFSMFGHKGDLDPWVQILVRRIVALRRMWFRHPPMRPALERLVDYHLRSGTPGIVADPADHSDALPAPPGAGWGAATTGEGPLGPVGLLAAAVASFGLSLTTSFSLIAEHEPPLNVLKVPWQTLRPRVEELAAAARYRHATTTRQDIRHAGPLDHYCSHPPGSGSRGV